MIKKWVLELHLKKYDGEDSPDSSAASSPRLSNASTTSDASSLPSSVDENEGRGESLLSNQANEDINNNEANAICNTCRNCFTCWLRRRDEATDYQKRQEYERIAYKCLDAEMIRIIDETEMSTYEQEARLRLVEMQLGKSRDYNSTPSNYTETDSDELEEMVKQKTTRKKNQY